MLSHGERIDRLIAIVEQAGAQGLLSSAAVGNLLPWLTERPYAAYRPRLVELIEAGDFPALEGFFWRQIPFGTGGRRGPMGELGSATINERTIAESAFGLATYLQRVLSGTAGSAVVACDTRHQSQEFAELTATTLAACGLKVYLFESFRSTPELSFAVRYLKCDVGAMISASHNPPGDNGVKAYWNTGGQVLPPHDAGIIRCVGEAGEIPRMDLQQAMHAGRIQIVGSEIDQAYWNAVLQMSLSSARDLPALYSPLHGAGETCCWQLLTRAGFRGMEIFEPHREPCGDFPNVPDHLPNPERVQVFEPMFARGERLGAELLLASDPDADRLAACVRDRQGRYVHLSGNQVGALLADYILTRRAARGDLTSRHYVVETLVTTRLIGAIARAHGVRVIDDLLVGFKYIAETMDAEGPDRFVFGAEESLGYLAGAYARDKDAGIAALYLAECAAELRQNGRTLLDRLDELAVAHGYHYESQISKTCEGAEGNRQIRHIMAAFRESPPASVGDATLAVVRDYERHEVRRLPDNVAIDNLPQPSGDLLIFESDEAGAHVRIAVRPSGTEPKIKFYLFARSPCSDAVSLPVVKTQTRALVKQVSTDLNAWIDRLPGR